MWGNMGHKYGDMSAKVAKWRGREKKTENK